MPSLPVITVPTQAELAAIDLFTQRGTSLQVRIVNVLRQFALEGVTEYVVPLVILDNETGGSWSAGQAGDYISAMEPSFTASGWILIDEGQDGLRLKF